MKSFGNNLRELRIIAKMLQSDLADKLNVSRKTISHWESGYSEPSLEMLKKLKELFDVSYEDLLD